MATITAGSGRAPPPGARRRPPSYYRYMRENPAVTLHLPRPLKERIDQVKGEQSYGEFVRALLERFEAVVERRVRGIRRSMEITYPCDVCGQPLVLLPGNQDARAAVEYLKQNRWGHGSCHERQRQTGS